MAATLRDWLKCEYKAKVAQDSKAAETGEGGGKAAEGGESAEAAKAAEAAVANIPVQMFNKDTMRGCCPKVPQQPNFSDCGVFLLQYIESFFEVTQLFANLKIRQ